MDIDKANKICDYLDETADDILGTIGNKFGEKIRCCVAAYIQVDQFVRSNTLSFIKAERIGLMKTNGPYAEYGLHTLDGARILLNVAIRDDFLKLNETKQKELSALIAAMINKNIDAAKQVCE